MCSRKAKMAHLQLFLLFTKLSSCILSKTLIINHCHRRNYMAEGDRVEDILMYKTQKVAPSSTMAMPPLLVWSKGRMCQEGTDVLLP